VTDVSKRFFDQLMRGYLIALPKEKAALNDAAQITFLTQEQLVGATTTNPYAGPLALEIVDAVKLGDTGISVRVHCPDELSVENAAYYVLEEYRGYRWQPVIPAQGKTALDIRFAKKSKSEYNLLLDAYPPLEPGRLYRAALRVQVVNAQGETQMVNTAEEFRLR
jgi:hypothetical protein